MNVTEQKAYRWLEQHTGYSDLVFQQRRSPDFLAPDGTGYEVKKVRNGTILFTDAQWMSLQKHSRVKVVVFNDGSEPLDIVDFAELPTPPSYWKNYRLILVNLSYKSGRVIVPDDQEVLTPSETATYLRINQEVLRRLSEQGRIQGAYKVGSQWRYVKAELLKRSKLDLSS